MFYPKTIVSLVFVLDNSIYKQELLNERNGKYRLESHSIKLEDFVALNGQAFIGIKL
jgi:hypothetical protein